MLTEDEKTEINLLVKKIKTNDLDAFRQLYNKLYVVIYNFLRRYCRQKETIEDAIADCFIVIWEKSSNKIFYKNCYSWILKIAKNILFNKIRKTSREESLEKAKDVIFNDREASGDIYLKSYLENLPDRQYSIVYMKVFEKLTYKEISKELKLSRSTVIRLYDQAMKNLEDNINEK